MVTNGTLWCKVSSKETFCCRGLKIFATPSIDFLCVYLFDTLE
jgi:hypothetical protein